MSSALFFFVTEMPFALHFSLSSGTLSLQSVETSALAAATASAETGGAVAAEAAGGAEEVGGSVVLAAVAAEAPPAPKRRDVVLSCDACDEESACEAENAWEDDCDAVVDRVRWYGTLPLSLASSRAPVAPTLVSSPSS